MSTYHSKRRCALKGWTEIFFPCKTDMSISAINSTHEGKVDGSKLPEGMFWEPEASQWEGCILISAFCSLLHCLDAFYRSYCALKKSKTNNSLKGSVTGFFCSGLSFVPLQCEYHLKKVNYKYLTTCQSANCS